jgi:hypothetical protein
MSRAMCLDGRQQDRARLTQSLRAPVAAEESHGAALVFLMWILEKLANLASRAAGVPTSMPT